MSNSNSIVYNSIFIKLAWSHPTERMVSRPFVLWGYRGPQPLGGGDDGEAEPPCLLPGMDGLSIQEPGSKGEDFKRGPPLLSRFRLSGKRVRCTF